MNTKALLTYRPGPAAEPVSVVALLQVLLGHGLLPLDGLAEQGVAGLAAAELGEVAGHGDAVRVKARKGRVSTARDSAMHWSGWRGQG